MCQEQHLLFLYFSDTEVSKLQNLQPNKDKVQYAKQPEKIVEYEDHKMEKITECMHAKRSNEV